MEHRFFFITRVPDEPGSLQEISTGSIMLNLDGLTPERRSFNSLAVNLVTSVNVDPDLAREDRGELLSLAGSWERGDQPRGEAVPHLQRAWTGVRFTGVRFTRGVPHDVRRGRALLPVNVHAGTKIPADQQGPGLFCRRRSPPFQVMSPSRPGSYIRIVNTSGLPLSMVNP